jgi:imidazole glycerol-phosphate synthase subunit HisF
VIPILLLDRGRLVKTLRFDDATYVGDPVNVVRIFNEKEVDELAVIDVSATPSNSGPDFELLERIASEAFMPLSYGGGVSLLTDARKLFRLGFEKIVLQSLLFSDQTESKSIVREFGAQSVVAALDFIESTPGYYRLRDGISGSDGLGLEEALSICAEINVGELLITSVEREGTRTGLDLELLSRCRSLVSRPLVLNGGAKDLHDVRLAVAAGADAVAAGALFTFFGPFRSVMINYPSQSQLREVLI